ncbi:YitT family protein [Vagococcus sp. DIV0080]|uniref:YitT family protein n=1 Tax=Candidatus Vagococcus giribetii TaxID=2230876 RepID=A0ABS3HRG3_9ENTE|nr:YitT family protein [Vagococcus sp. DIV0080]MBO0476216.1 YitT family protein [Vagococcus sp. DIV0080]
MIVQKLNQLLGKRVVEIILITIGSFMVAVGFNAFLLPNRIVSGGINGLTIILHEMFNWSPSIVLYVVNIVLLIACFLILGKEIFMKSILGSLLVPMFISLLHTLTPATHEPILAAIFGGLCIGIGVGLVFVGNGSTGGTTLIAKMIQKFTNIKLGILVGFCDGLVILSALFIFDIQQVLYALISLFITSRVVDMVQVGPDLSKNLFIISPKNERIAELLMKELDSGVTFLPVEGGHRLDQKKMIMTTIRESNYTNIKQTILEIDPEAFMVVSSANEVYGKGFTLFRD